MGLYNHTIRQGRGRHSLAIAILASYQSVPSLAPPRILPVPSLPTSHQEKEIRGHDPCYLYNRDVLLHTQPPP